MLVFQRIAQVALAGLAAASLVSASGALGITSGRVAVTSPDGLSDVTYTLSEPAPMPSAVALGESTTMKLTFTVVDTSSSQAVFPQQAHLLFEDPKGGDVTLPVTVKSNGKASFTINTAKAPSALRHTHGTFSITLLLSSIDPSTTPLSYPLGQISLPPSLLRPLPRGRHDLPPRQGEPAFQPEQELFHTFRQDEKSVGMSKSALGTGLALSPWAILAVLYGQVSPKLEYKAPPPSSYVFLACLASLEALIVTYWIGLKLYQFLPIFIPLSLVSAYAGKVALASLRQRRLKAGGAP